MFLASGLLSVALLLTSSALLATILTLFDVGVTVGADAMVSLQVFTGELLGTFGARMAAVFTISVSSVGLRTGLVPRWLALAGYAAGLVLLLTPHCPPGPRWCSPAGCSCSASTSSQAVTRAELRRATPPVSADERMA